MIIRTATNPEDVRKAFDVYWLNETGKSDAYAAHMLDQYRHLCASCPEGFWIAEEEGTQRIVGTAVATLRPPQWMLTNFFVHPDFHGQGIGKALLAKAYETREGCTRFCIHASQHPSAVNLYMQLGVYPQPHSTYLTGNPDRLPKIESTLAVAQTDLTSALPTINALDAQTHGYTRQIDHQWWAKSGSYYLLKEGHNVVGYFRLSAHHQIGPLVVNDPRWIPDALDLAIQQLREITDAPLDIFLPGANTTSLAHLLKRGYRYDGYLELFFSSHPMPKLAQVVFFDTDLL
jgi:GNAT superfamily N-acetyltransferase